MSLIDLESNLDSMFYIDNEWICENDTLSNKNNYNVIVLNDRLMSETVQNEHSYFTNNISSYDGNLNSNYVDDDSNDTHSFKEMDIESECFPCIPMSSAIQLNAASFIGNHQLANSSETRLASSPSSSISSINSLCNSSLSCSSNGTANFLNNQTIEAYNCGTIKKSRKQKNVLNNEQNKTNQNSDSKNATLAALLNCSPLISSKSGSTCNNLPPTPPASNSDSDCEVNQSHLNDKIKDVKNNKITLEINGKNGQQVISNHQVKRQRANNNCSILVQTGSIINLSQQLSPNSLIINNNLAVNTNSNSNSSNSNFNEITNSSHSLPSSNNNNDHSLNDNYKAEASNLINLSNNLSTNKNRSSIQSMSSLISVQPKNAASGTAVILTEEEKRTLIAEGYPIPTKFPLTKAEERSLKKIRRKIKNKISAQESRRKKKEYMEELERKVCLLDERVKQLERENEQLKLKTLSVNDQNIFLQTKSTNKQNKQNFSNCNLMSIKLETNDEEKEIKNDDLIEYNCDLDQSMQNIQNNLVVLTTKSDQEEFIDDDDDDEDF